MTTYVWSREAMDWVEPGPPAPRTGPFIWSDLRAYKSPLGTGMIEGRAARREDLKRGGCREVDPSEWRPNPKTAKQAEAERKQLEQRARQPFALSDTAKTRLMEGKA